MKLYSIRLWDEIYENNRSRNVVNLAWVAIPNRHDGENFTNIMSHKDGATIFAAFVLMVQIASKCEPRGTLKKDNGTPHDASSLSVKCRAPKEWFKIAIDYLEKETDWLEYQEVAVDYQRPVSVLSASCQSGDEEGRDRKERTEGKNLPLVKEIFDAWNTNGDLTKCLVISDKRKTSLLLRIKDPFFKENWKLAMARIPQSAFCMGRNERGWRANFDWFIQPDTVAKIMEGKYDASRPPKKLESGFVPDAILKQ